jgi:hypothetical protein
VNKHFRCRKRSNLHTLFFCFGNSKNICNPSPSAFNVTKNVQYDKKLQKIWNIWCKGVQCLVINELKQIKISSWKFWIVVFEIERSFVKPYLCTHHVLNHSKWKRYEVGIKEGFKIIFVKTFEIIYHLSFSCVFFCTTLLFWTFKKHL